MVKKTILYFGVAIFFLTIYYIVKLNTQKELDSIFKKPYYAIGIVFEYNKNTPGYHYFNSNLQSVRYFYEVNNKIYENKYDCTEYKIKENVKKGDRYLVIYNTDEPEESRLLTNFSINDSSDYKHYINLIKEGKLKIE